MLEKRNHQRIELGIRIASKDNRIGGFTKDISVGGCFIEKTEDFHLLPIGSTIPFFLEIPGEYAYMEIEGVVKHHGKGGDGMGICFDKMNCGVEALIDQFLHNHSHKYS